MASELSAVVHSLGDMRFEATSGSGQQIIMDAGSGEKTGMSPMELVLVALAGCTGVDVISILRKKRLNVQDYTVRVHGKRAEEHPRVYKEITVEHIVTGHDLKVDAVQQAVELSANKYCSVDAMLHLSAQITHVVRLVEGEQSDNTASES